MSVHEYIGFLRTQPFGNLVALSMIARLPMSMISLGIALMITRSGGFGAAGVVLALFAVGQTVSGPIAGRAIDRYGRAAILRPLALVQGILLVFLSTMPVANVTAIAACAAAAGLATPPMTSTIRGLWADIVPKSQQGTVFALEATLQEVAYLTGPVVVALLTATSSPRAAVAATGVTVVAGVLLFLSHPNTRNAPARSGRQNPRAPRARVALPFPLLLAAIATLVALTGAELATVAFSEDRGVPAAAGLLIAIWSVGSLLSGMLWGARAASGNLGRRVTVLVALLAAAVAVPALGGNLWVFAGLMIPAGLCIVPLFAVLYALAAADAPKGAQTEAFAWLASAFQIGSVVGPSLAGVIIEANGFRSGFLFGTAALALALVTLLLWGPARRRSPADASMADVVTGEVDGSSLAAEANTPAPPPPSHPPTPLTRRRSPPPPPPPLR